MSQLFSCKDETAVVIGGTGVLGLAMAKALSDAEAKVVIVGRNEERGNAAVKELTGSGGQALFVPADATDRTSLEQANNVIEREWGTPTILVNAAGGNDPKVTVTPENPFEGITKEDWQNNFDLNLVGGALFPCQVFGSAMARAGKGSIINIASVSAHIPLSRVISYSAAKAAVISLTLFLSREWAKSGVRVNTLTPGFFPAEQNRRLLFDENGKPTARAESILGHTPMGRFGEPEELGGAVVFLASEASRFVTGIDLRVDGGFLSTTI
ncbi:MAG: SDR family oxidoreductase [Verrucomicrobiales bacterium]